MGVALLSRTTTVAPGGFLQADSGYALTGFAVPSATALTFAAGAVASGTVVGAGATEFDFESETTVDGLVSGGSQVVFAGGVVSGTTGVDGGELFMMGTEVNVTVSSGGRNVVLAGGIVNGARWLAAASRSRPGQPPTVRSLSGLEEPP